SRTTTTRTVFDPTSTTPAVTPSWCRHHMTSPLMTPGQPARALATAHEHRLCGAAPLSLLGSEPLPGAVALQHPRLCVVREERLEDRFDLVPHVEVLDRNDDLDAVNEVARHDIGAAEEVGPLVVDLEAVEPAVLQEAAEDRTDADVLAQPFDAGDEGADRAHDEIDLRPRLGRAVQLVDDVRVGEVVDLDLDVCALARLGGRSNRPNPFDEPLLQVELCDEDLPEALRSPEPRDEVEEIGDVRADVGVGREEAEVLVDTCRRRVVVAGPDVDVTLQLVALAADDERRLRMDLHVGEPVDDVHTRLLERSGPFDVPA